MPRVLVADDDAVIRRLLQHTLEYGGYEVVIAADGAEAIGLLSSERDLDVVVTDYSMPNADGIDVIAAAQTIDSTLPCIIVTAFGALDVAMRGMQAGAVGFIPKPFKADHLLTVVQKALERRQLSMETVRLRLLAPMLEHFTMVLANTLESKDLSTGQHSQRLVSMADLTAAELGIDGERRGAIRLGACLHDIGKVGVPSAILRKVERLSDEEFDAVRAHPEIGATILEGVETWEEVREIVRHHHERYDGTGYPGGLAAEAIPLGARIVCVVDSFDVMREGRPYSPAREIDEVVGELRTHSGRQFDPDIVTAFLRVLERGAPLQGARAAVTG
ncbi:MAG: HD-GYP domain-containing protein [Candidatus Dormibacteria bacterium]